MNIIIADDIEGWLNFHKKYLTEFLSNQKLNIYEFFSAQEAYDFAFTFKDNIDLVMTDMSMEPKFDEYAGQWLIENLKTLKQTENSKFIIISSAPDIKNIKEITGADGYLRKMSYRNNPLMLKYLLDETGLTKDNEIKR